VASYNIFQECSNIFKNVGQHYSLFGLLSTFLKIVGFVNYFFIIL
jgi:hypothetical protein